MAMVVSATRAEALAVGMTELARDLRANEPSVALALRAGVKDKSYDTVANGWVLRYEGEAVVKLANGREYRCVGHGPRGDAHSIYRQGFIEFIWLNPDEATEEKISEATEAPASA